MLTKLPRGYTLDDLLKADPLTALYATIEAAEKNYAEANPEHASRYQATVEEISAKYEDPELEKKVAQHSWATEDGVRAIAFLYEVTAERLKQALEFTKGQHAAVDKAVNEKTLIRSWHALKRKAGIKDVGEKDFPKMLERPMLVLFSADWCGPCRMMRPTFARLVPFFDKADVRYCHEDEWRRGQGVHFIPQFIAYFPNGAKVSSEVGGNTCEIWDTMNKLITLGASWTGEGELVCDKYSCAIVPKITQQ